MSGKNEPTAVLLKRAFRGLDIPSFQLIPLNSNAPFVAATFDPAQLFLHCITSLTYDVENHLAKLSKNGTQIPIRINGQNSFEKERVMTRSAHENYIDGKENILQYVQAVCGTTDFNDGTNLSDLLDQHIKRVQGEILDNEKKVAEANETEEKKPRAKKAATK